MAVRTRVKCFVVFVLQLVECSKPNGVLGRESPSRLHAKFFLSRNFRKRNIAGFSLRPCFCCTAAPMQSRLKKKNYWSRYDPRTSEKQKNAQGKKIVTGCSPIPPDPSTPACWGRDKNIAFARMRATRLRPTCT